MASIDSCSLERRAYAYLAKLPLAIGGQGGHNATFYAACRLREFGLPFESALNVLRTWNETHCRPAWTEKELRHKLTEAFKRTYPKAQFVSVGTPSHPKDPPVNKLLERRQAAEASATIKSASPWTIASIAERLHEGTETELTALAGLRGLSLAGTRLASQRGLLLFGEFQGKAAWFISGGPLRVIQARRLDGKSWMEGVKALVFKGSQATWPVGIDEAADFRSVALCEGAPDLLAACHFIVAGNRVSDCAPLAMLSAAYSIAADALRLFAGKKVRIYAHEDCAGRSAAHRWETQLEKHFAEVEIFSFVEFQKPDGSPVKDLNDLAHCQLDKHLLETLLP